MAKVELEHVWKIYDGKVEAVKDATFTIEDKEFVVLLGPSGCGKTTTLRMIAGLEEITKGTLKIDGKVMNDVEPKDRDIAMVFQNYALYPHMTVYDNMAFGLKLRKVPKDEIDRRVKEAAKILGIEEYLDRKPRQLSGGQRQRVAVGRAIVRNPKVFLFDEPLSNLDAKLRTQMRSELKKLHHRLEATIVYVTHDQIEAMTMADKIIVMKDGVIQQIGSPHEIYNKPANTFVAGFIGSPAMNFVNAKIIRENGLWIKSSGLKLKVPSQFEETLEKYIDKDIIFGIRPENIYDKMFAMLPKEGENTARAKVDVVEPLGSETILHLVAGEDKLVAVVDPKTEAKEEQEIDLVFDMNTMHVFDKETGKAIL
ncbi:sugar ABC transporter ATP-binding protein [Thermosipho africanus H17ap60334]|jgi:multiple sugar transport system ATP-binding protein|uniref:Sugar ABC transporter, ATP-binding protein n=1 Tax=Thermosipho africanus (strain TCF52B) TaxID=484019 RepID=B7IDB0_THEAB|nr:MULTISPECIES: sn-glycerol-3-phosphate ABC transporter ATP-binding protein UgpC [Thermosipho]ACJ75987.1 sugar ABC transporter, ATP-binding protein [Thermosipho africanus TCF52B]EKF49549.1 sugar ABC transporter ATP-binding protein [Thermosipho africanus H17ap60334]MBZ4650303.1 sugar transporter, ATP-binding protein [Thermosipho sp. (in: thermotogales)]MDK2840376.1 multiple sugar transport system ATP-binding protein [Thermosipho sp. (in: thermotogales)]MDK2900015.1 multiple sugar transport sys